MAFEFISFCVCVWKLRSLEWNGRHVSFARPENESDSRDVMELELMFLLNGACGGISHTAGVALLKICQRFELGEQASRNGRNGIRTHIFACVLVLCHVLVCHRDVNCVRAANVPDSRDVMELELTSF